MYIYLDLSSIPPLPSIAFFPLNLMHPHIHPHPKFPPPPHNSHPSEKRPRPYRKRQHLPAQPRHHPFPHPSPLIPRLRKRRPFRLGCTPVLQHAPDVAIDDRPGDDAQEEYREERKPCLGYAQRFVAPGKSGETPCAVGGAQEGLRTGLDERGERDGEFADAQPAGAAVDVGGQGCVGDGLRA